MSKLKHLATVLAAGVTLTAGIALTASAARAEVLEFNLTGTSGDETWYQTVPAHVTRPFAGEYTAVSVYDASGFISNLSSVEYRVAGDPGGLNLHNGSSFDDFYGVQIFGGTVFKPTFSPTGGNPIALSGGESLAITAVPEPATWALMITGVFGLGAVLRARRGGVLAAA